ncbi:uncharacterized protein [Oryza sativa Japonica Group]|uniref:uncharacterized protein isoform X1 n=1 Tax=Oryza sativa subsp. japonica TaxID=39947 RepID=UPI000E1C2AE5|nr:uncharacterized protein LOC4327085 isoform X1 [Oryza sativa Japonica Group]
MEKMGGILLQHHQISPNYLAKAAFPGSFALHKVADFANGILLCPPRNSFSCSSLGSIRSEANGSPLPRTVNRRSKEELIEFFKSIQTSIAEESPRTSRRTRKQSSDPFEEVERRKQSYGIADVSEEHADGEPKALDLNDMKVAELRELARARRMKGYSRLKKSELIDRLKGV